jgi:TonB family protein
MLAQVVALMALGAAACATHQPEPTRVELVPQRLWSPPLAYPDSLMLARIEGSVMLRANVDTTGRVDPASIRVLRSTNKGFEAPAIDMLVATRFSPARRDGALAVAVIEVPVKFELEDTVADSVAAAEAMADGQRLARAGSLDPAVAAFEEAQRLDTRLASSTAIWWTLCWYGSVWDHAADFIGTCDRLVAHEPNDVRARDARGFARALTGDFQGAIADFEAVIAGSTSPGQRAERTEWVQTLRAGRNPVTPEVLARLRSREPQT